MSDVDEFEPEQSQPRPRIRFGAIAWGLIVCAIAVTVWSIISSPTSRSEVTTWFWELSPGTAILVAILALGALMLLLGILSLIRKAQSRQP